MGVRYSITHCSSSLGECQGSRGSDAVKCQIMAISPRKLSGLPDRVATYEPQGIAAQDQGLFPRAKPEQLPG
jgi:hypothetical protein